MGTKVLKIFRLKHKSNYIPQPFSNAWLVEKWCFCTIDVTLVKPYNDGHKSLNLSYLIIDICTGNIATEKCKQESWQSAKFICLVLSRLDYDTKYDMIDRRAVGRAWLLSLQYVSRNSGP